MSYPYQIGNFTFNSENDRRAALREADRLAFPYLSSSDESSTSSNSPAGVDDGFCNIPVSSPLMNPEIITAILGLVIVMELDYYRGTW